MGRERIVELVEKHNELAEKAQDLLEEAAAVSRDICDVRTEVVWEERLLSAGSPWKICSELGVFHLESNFPNQPALVDYLELIPNDEVTLTGMTIQAGPQRIDGAIAIYLTFVNNTGSDLLEFCRVKEIPFEADELKIMHRAMSKEVSRYSLKLEALQALVDEYT